MLNVAADVTTNAAAAKPSFVLYGRMNAQVRRRVA
jgi:hypothetical protein